jgi:hypothetical protein
MMDGVLVSTVSAKLLELMIERFEECRTKELKDVSFHCIEIKSTQFLSTKAAPSGSQIITMPQSSTFYNNQCSPRHWGSSLLPDNEDNRANSRDPPGGNKDEEIAHLKHTYRDAVLENSNKKTSANLKTNM